MTHRGLRALPCLCISRVEVYNCSQSPQIPATLLLGPKHKRRCQLHGPRGHRHACLLSRSVVSDSFTAPWTIACHAPLTMGFPQQGYWRGLPFLQEITVIEKEKKKKPVPQPKQSLLTPGWKRSVLCGWRVKTRKVCSGKKGGAPTSKAPIFQNIPERSQFARGASVGIPETERWAEGPMLQERRGRCRAEHILFSWKLYHICHPKVQPPNHRRNEKRDVPQHKGSKCLHSIIREPRGSCKMTHAISSGQPTYARHARGPSKPLSRTGHASRQAPRLALYDEQTEARGIEGTCLKTGGQKRSS